MNSHNELLPYPMLPSGELPEGQEHSIVFNGEVEYQGTDNDVARLIYNTLRFPMVVIANLI